MNIAGAHRQNLWHHSPLHLLLERGIYMVTAGTYNKEKFFKSPEALQVLYDGLRLYAVEFGWTLHAWAVLSNHYHFIAQSPENPANLKMMLGKLHMMSAKFINHLEGKPGRKVWHQYWETRLDFEKSYLARLNYVNQNPVKHGITTSASAYRWCSASFFETDVDPSLQRTITSLAVDKLKISDDF